MSKMTMKQKKTLRKIFDNLLKDSEESDCWSMDTENGFRELTTSELIEKDLIKDGCKHYEVTGETTITIRYQIEKKRRVV